MKLFNADCIDTLKELEDNTIDSIVTDPPYFINFMGKKWDAKKHIASHPDFWRECLRVLKPGGHCLAFGHSRTHHRLFTAIEDAGFTIKDTIMWMYGSGFPKSHNIGKAVDALRKKGKSNPKALKEVEQEHGGKAYKLKGKNNGIMGESVVWERKEYQTETGWEGWGTALKPAYEPICLAQKPKEGTYAKNVLKHGVGGLNIDASRVGSTEDFSNVKPRTMMTNTGSVAKSKKEGKEHDHSAAESLQEAKEKLQTLGRFPANLILTHHPECKVVGETVEKSCNHNAPTGTFAGGEENRGSEKVYRQQENKIKVYECVKDCPCAQLNKQSGKSKSNPNILKEKYKDTELGDNTNFTRGNDTYYTDAGGASRFFKQTEASPICLAQKPREGTYANNLIEHGVGALNIDECRVGKDIMPERTTPTATRETGWEFAGWTTPEKTGRFPANVILQHHPDCKLIGEKGEQLAFNVDFKDELQSDAGWGTKRCVTEEQTIISPVYECVEECPCAELDAQTPNAGGGHWTKTKTKGYGKFGNGESTYEGPGPKDKKGGASKFFKQIGVNQPAETTITNGKGNKWVENNPHGERTGESVLGVNKQNTGRFPANVLLSHHDDCKQIGVGHETVVGGNKGKSGFAQGYESGDFTKEQKIYPIYECVDDCPIKELDTQAPHDAHQDGLAGASRFFYCAKSGKKERNKYVSEDAPVKSAETRTPTAAGIYAEKGFNPPRRNHHPTVKPLKLMNYLIKLITPPGGTVLDPFMGSGSTGIAAIEGGWNFMGIEREEEYFNIAKTRLESCEKETEK